MSEPLNIAIVQEGVTDFIAIKAIVKSLLGERDFNLQSLQPTISESFSGVRGESEDEVSATYCQVHNTGDLEGGWSGVYHWIEQIVEQADGKISDHFLLDHHDVFIVHVDADVADKTYSEAGIAKDAPVDLPCAGPCPLANEQNTKVCEEDCSIARENVDALRRVILGWMGEDDTPENVIFCIPSKAMEAWVIAAMFPEDSLLVKGKLECYDDPQRRFKSKPAGRRIAKTADDYTKKVVPFLQQNWSRVATQCREAERFSLEFLARVADS